MTPDTVHPTALIAEDEPLLAEALAAELQRQWPALRIVARVSHGAAAVEQALALRPQVVFMDIRMPGLDGLQAAEALTEAWPDDGTPFPRLVFVTAYDQYAVQAFEHAAIDYLLKPVQPERLALTCERLQSLLTTQQPASQAAPPALAHNSLEAALAALRALAAQASTTAPPSRLSVLQASRGSTLYFVPVDEVLYFEAADKYVRVVTAHDEHLIRSSLRELLPQLDAEQFWQVHRGVVVRAQAIERATRDEAGKLSLHLRQRPDTLAVSRLYAHRFKAM